jgi:hypothetical protein
VAAETAQLKIKTLGGTGSAISVPCNTSTGPLSRTGDCLFPGLLGQSSWLTPYSLPQKCLGDAQSHPFGAAISGVWLPVLLEGVVRRASKCEPHVKTSSKISNH